MNKKLKKEAIKWISDRLNYCEKDIERLKKSLGNLYKGDGHFKIYLKSMWSDIGEEDIIYISSSSDSLVKSCKEADRLFMEKNKRDNVQAWRFAWLMIPNGENYEAIPIQHPFDEKKNSMRIKEKNKV